MTQIVAPGELLADRFLIVRFIAAGGMGEVYEAEDKVLGGRLAVKLLSRRAFGEEVVQQRFRREIQIARKVTHTNVCRIFDVFQHQPLGGRRQPEPVSFVTMELLEGETLESFLDREAPLSEERALPMIEQMAAGLSAAHAAGVVHRDFKTNNVMLVPVEGADGAVRAVVTDFGLARSFLAARESSTDTPLTGATSLMGTVDYIAPELLHGQEVSPQSDIYALGVVMFEMVAGRKPYTGAHPIAVLAQRTKGPPPSPRAFRPELDPVWEQTILRCLEEEPAARPASTPEVVAALGGTDSSTTAILGPFVSETSGTFARPVLDTVPDEHDEPLPSSPQRTWILPASVALILVLALIVAGWWWRGGERPRPFSSFNPVQVTSSAGLELDPTFSPDGTAIAYSSDRDGSFEIWRRDLTPGGQAVRLTSAGEQLFEPAWSPDGRRIAYHSQKQGGIWTIPAAGGPPVRLTEFGSRPAWSPDGSTVAFQSESAPQLADTAVPALALSTLWTVAADGTQLRQLTLSGSPDGGHGAPTWSPDGSRIVFSTSRYGSSEIWAVELASKTLNPLVRRPTTAYGPTYAPDGHSLFFSARSRQVNGLWRLPVSPRTGQATAPPEQIANLGLASIRQLAISADGGKLAYATMSTVSNLWTLELDPASAAPQGRPAPLTTGTGRNNRPTFSPDGSRVAFDRFRPGVSIDVWTMAATGGDETQVTTSDDDRTQPSWFPGGDRLMLHSGEDDGGRGLWTVDLVSREQSRIQGLESGVRWAKMSPDGTRVAYHSRATGGGDSIWILELASGERRQVTGTGLSMAFPCWSPDGNWLTFQKREEGHSQVMVMPAEGGEATALTDVPGQNWPYSFSPDGDKIVFAAMRGREWNLWWVSRSTGEEQRLTEPPKLNQYVRYPAWSPAGDRIVYELAQTTGDLFLVENTGR